MLLLRKNRICLLQLDEDELQLYFGYELAPFALTLFHESLLIRKTKKSAIYDTFTLVEKTVYEGKCHYVIDGGFLLHRIVWPSKSTFEDLCDSYCRYTEKNYSSLRNVSVIFDGYEEVGLKAVHKIGTNILHFSEKKI